MKRNGTKRYHNKSFHTSVLLWMVSTTVFWGACRNFVEPIDEAGEATWTLIGFGDESIKAIATDPFDDDIIYVSSHFHGLFKSTDMGGRWEKLSDIGGRDIDIHPFHRNTIYMSGNFLIKTIDGGKNWIEVDVLFYGSGSEACALDMYVINPLLTEILYAGAGGLFSAGISVSMDGGKIWNRSLNGEITALAVDPVNGNVIYAGTAWTGSIYRSTDGALSWKRLNFPYTGIVHDIAVDPLNPSIVYVGAEQDGFYYSDNGGETWHSANQGITDIMRVTKISLSKNKIFIATDTGVYQSSKNLMRWICLGNPFPRHHINTLLTLDENNIFVGTKSGLYLIKI